MFEHDLIPPNDELPFQDLTLDKQFLSEEIAGKQHAESRTDAAIVEYIQELLINRKSLIDLANASVPLQGTGDDVEGLVLSEKALGKKCATECQPANGIEAGEGIADGEIGEPNFQLHHPSIDEETATPHNGAYLDRVGQSHQLSN